MDIVYADKERQRKGYFRITLELLHEVLQLPEDVKIDAVRSCIEFDDDPAMVAVVLSGDGLPKHCGVSPGDKLMQLSPQYRSVMTPQFDGWMVHP